MKIPSTKAIVIAVTAAIAATTAYNIKVGPKKLGPCSYELEEMARKAQEEKRNKDTASSN